jgi:predicted phosphodiesterase
MKNLLVGDVHATPEELPDCEALLGLVLDTVRKNRVDVVTFMGDQYNTHDVVNTRCIEFWQRWFGILKKEAEIYALKGNHDQVNPIDPFPHAMLAHPDILVVDKPTIMSIPGCAAIPYYSDSEKLIEATEKLVLDNPGLHTLFCHATLQGAKYENGFFAKDAADISRIPFARIFSGHIHSPQKCGKAIYVGAPRWRTRNDANIERHLWLLEHEERSIKLVNKTPTGQVCRRIFTHTDLPEAPIDPQGYTRGKDKLLVDVMGPTEKYVRTRESELRAMYGAETRGFPKKEQRTTVSEAVGIETSFESWFHQFKPQHGTSKDTLSKMVEERIHVR